MQFLHATVLACVLASLAVLPATAQETALDAANALPNTGLPLDDAVVSQIYSAQDLQVMDHLAELVDGIGPRLTSSDNLTEACHWAADKFEQWGLENVRMEEWGTFPVGFNRRVMSGRMTSPSKKKLVFTTNSWSAGTDGPTRAQSSWLRPQSNSKRYLDPSRIAGYSAPPDHVLTATASPPAPNWAATWTKKGFWV